MNTKTLFAPADRATTESVMNDAYMLAEAGIVDHITNVIPSILMVLNKERQVVYSNQRLLDYLKIDSKHNILGLRPGEILHCIHSHEECNGCGTTEFCGECGAVKAILKSQNEKVGIEAECRITTTDGNALELKVWASPYQHENMDYTIFSIIDIHNEKRRQALEHTFFHDMTNVLTAISGNSRLLEMAHNEEESRQFISAIRTACKELNAEIGCHRKLLQAENDELQLEIEQGIKSVELMNQLIQVSVGRNIVLDLNSNDFEITTDRTLLFRILFNMVKNALDAAMMNEIVTISCRREGENGIFSVHNPNFMDRPTQLQIFQRSFTTKGKGRGLGTYSMRLFGEKYLKGKVGFSTSKELGTTFHIVLPLDLAKK